MIIRELNVIGADFIILSYYKVIELDNDLLIEEIIKFYNQLKNRIIENNQFQILLTDIKENLFKTKFGFVPVHHHIKKKKKKKKNLKQKGEKIFFPCMESSLECVAFLCLNK